MQAYIYILLKKTTAYSKQWLICQNLTLIIKVMFYQTTVKVRLQIDIQIITNDIEYDYIPQININYKSYSNLV